MEQAEQKFTASVDSAIDTLRQFKESWLQRLREKAQLSTIIESAIREAQNCLAQRTRPTSHMAEALFSSPEQLPIFLTIHSPYLQTNLPIYTN